MGPQNNTRSTGAFSPTRRRTLDLGGGPLSRTMMAPGVDGIWKHIMGLRKNTNNRLASSAHLLPGRVLPGLDTHQVSCSPDSPLRLLWNKTALGSRMGKLAQKHQDTCQRPHRKEDRLDIVMAGLGLRMCSGFDQREALLEFHRSQKICLYHLPTRLG